MGDHPKPQVSAIPLEAAHPARPRVPVALWLLTLTCVVAAVTGAVWIFMLSDRKPPRQPAHTWPQDPDITHRRSSANHQAALEQMQRIAEAMVAYRDGPGGGLRWPNALDELRYAGTIAADFDFTGPLSGQLVVYNPEMPLGHDPARWVMVHDIQIGWIRSANGYSSMRGIVAAAVMLGDGTVKLLDTEEARFYAGLSMGPEAAR